MVAFQLHALLLILVLGTLHSVNVDAAIVEARRSSSQCQSMKTSFPADDVAWSPDAPFQVVSPEGSYSVDEDGLKLYLEKPRAMVHTKGGVNNIVAEGATVNSTFYML